MRVNTIGNASVTPPEVRPEVGATRAVAPIGAQTPPREAPPVPASASSVQPVPVAATAERRHSARRGDDRRKQRQTVLIDTRVSQRRKARRRTADAAPPNIDTEA